MSRLRAFRRWHAHHHFVRHPLYRQIFFSVMAVVLLVCCIAALIFSHLEDPDESRLSSHLVPLLTRLLPADESAAMQATTLANLAALAHGSAALYDPHGARIAQSGPALPAQLNNAGEGSPHRFEHLLPLPDGRRLLLRWGAPRSSIAIWIAAVALLIALGTWPVARRLTRRLERLQRQADAWGEGKLATRMSIDGRDEVAELAHRFNQAAERIESLVNSQRAMLAAASHELRSPLARIRMAMDLLEESASSAGQGRPDLHQQVAHDIAELDALIGDLLLASRLADDSPRLERVQLDLLGLAAEEAARSGAQVSGEAICVRADQRLLRHLIRNLLDNAVRYAPASTIELEVGRSSAEQISLRVLDRGPGIPEAERERIFEPFYRLAGSAERGEGSGYGLALVRRIARLHGGDVRCLARPGGGACFELTLPA